MPTKRTLRSQNTELWRRLGRALAEQDDARKQRDTERVAKQTTARVAAESDATITRLTGRANRLKEQLAEAMDGRTDGEYTRLTKRLENLTLAYAKLREELTARSDMPLDWRAERSDLIRRLDLAERARRDLSVQLAGVQAANDAMCREAVTAAGTLTVPARAGREPGVAA